MKKAFTMIELIFVIVIIGILAAVAIPKLVATRDDAEAAMCVHEVGQLINEISSRYTKVGNAVFTSATVSTMTNIAIVGANGTQGIKEDTKVDTLGINYRCDGKDIVSIVGHNAGEDYNLTVTVTAGVTPVSLMASQEVIKSVIGGSSPKIFGL